METPDATPHRLRRAQYVLDTISDGVRTAAVVWLLAVGLWSGPSFGATLVYPNFLLPVEGLLAVALLVLGFRGRMLSVRRYPFFLPCLGVTALLLVAACFRWLGGTPPEPVAIWKYTEPMARGLLLFLALAGQPHLRRIAWISLLVGLALPAVAAILQHLAGVTRWYAGLDNGWAGGWHPVRGWRAQGLTSYINLTAAMLASSLPFWFLPAVYRGTWRRASRLLLAVGSMGVTAALWYTNSRGPFIAVVLVSSLLLGLLSTRWGVAVLLATAVFFLVIWPEQPLWAVVALLAAVVLGITAHRRKVRLLLPIALGLGMAGGLMALDAFVLHSPLGWRITDRGLADRARTALYHELLRGVPEAPWWGIGDAAVAEKVHYADFTPLRRLPQTQRNAHNQYLHWAVADGIPAALGFTLLVVWAVLWCWRTAPSRSSPFTRTFGYTTAAGLTIFLLTNLTDAHFWRIEGGGFFWSLLAVNAAFGVEPPERGEIEESGMNG